MRAANSKLALRATWMATKAAAAVSPGLAGPPAARLWFTPWRIEPGERAARRQREWLAGTESVSFDSGRLSGYSAGDGPAVMLVHGWGERAASLGAFVAPLVAAGYRVVGVDLPAHGASAGGRTDGLKIAAAIRTVRDSLGDVRAVVAHSMGATTTLYAAREGLDVKALVLLAPSVRLDRALQTFGGLFKLPPAAVIGLKATIDRRYGSDIWDRLSGTTIASDVRIPGLIVHDREDPQVALADAEALHAAWEGSAMVTTEGLGHGRILRDPDVIRRVTEFLEEKAPARTRVEA